MVYHIYSGAILDSFKKDCDCPLCEIERTVEEGILQEFLNDAVMDDNMRSKVNKLGFCDEHFDKLFVRQNKLALALQVQTRLDTLIKELNGTSPKSHVKILEKAENNCLICDLINESMEKYYKTVAYMCMSESGFIKMIADSNGFCLKHYKELLKYSSHAKGLKKQYEKLIKEVELNRLNTLKTDVKAFCDKHDYRNRTKPLGNAEFALPNARKTLYSEKRD